ncbi:MAG: STN domain-containing protein, partial [Verrucomicrobiota bacterium]
MTSRQFFFRAFASTSAAWTITVFASLFIAGQAIARPLRFSIDAQPAASALGAFSKQSGAQVTFSRDELANVATTAVFGDYEPGDALNRLLENTGFTATLREADWFVVSRRRITGPVPPPAAADVPSRQASELPAQLEQYVVTGSASIISPVEEIKRQL